MNDIINAILFKEPKAPANTPPLLLFFSEVAVKDERASKNGPPVFAPVHQVRVVVAGSKGDEGPIYELARKRADGEWKIDTYAYGRFGKPYDDWKAGRASADAGTPQEQWPLMDVALVAAFKAANVYTVQQLAELPDGLLDTAIRRGGREWRAKAKAWLDEARTAAGDVEARATIARQQDQINQLVAQVAEMQKKGNKEALGYDKPKRGRVVREDADETVDVVEEAGARL
jgi:hypothetical protein